MKLLHSLALNPRQSSHPAAAALTCGHLSDQHCAELNDRAEGVLAVGRGGQDLAVAPQHQPVVLLL